MTNQKPSKPSNLTLENRELLRVTGVTDIDSFNEESVILFTTLGELVIKGKLLHVNSINVDTGDAEVVGEIKTISYTNRKFTKKPGAVKRLLR